jgi:2-oxoisovalerate dehydrogenase E1 component
MSLRAARHIRARHGWSVRVVDLRWLVPLNVDFIRAQAADARRILIVDEGRRSGGVGEGIVTAVVEGGFGARPFKRIAGADTYTPLAGAAFLVIPSEQDIVTAADELAQVRLPG